MSNTAALDACSLKRLPCIGPQIEPGATLQQPDVQLPSHQLNSASTSNILVSIFSTRFSHVNFAPVTPFHQPSPLLLYAIAASDMLHPLSFTLPVRLASSELHFIPSQLPYPSFHSKMRLNPPKLRLTLPKKRLTLRELRLAMPHPA